MSSDASANIGYGLEIPKKLLNSEDDPDEFILNEIESDKDLDYMFSGYSYDDDGDNLFLIIKKSHIQIYSWESGAKKINLAKIVIGTGWDDKLKAWAKAHKISKPKIGWWLTCSVV